MISVIGLGNAGSKIAAIFDEYPQYSVYQMNDKVGRTSKYKFKLKSFETPEEYEDSPPDLEKFFATIGDHVQFIVVGASFSSNYSLSVLQQLQGKKIDVIYVKPDTELLTGLPELVENVVFGVLQEYARSGLFNSFSIFSNHNIENILGNVPIRNYYSVLNSSIASTIHYLNYFDNAEPEIGQVSRVGEINRIRTCGLLSTETLEEKWFFDLQNPRDLCYYLCINSDKLENDGGLHRRIVDQLKEKPKNAFRKISYAIYETEHKQSFGFCVAHTNVVQENSK
jgi:hypothetical protein